MTFDDDYDPGEDVILRVPVLLRSNETSKEISASCEFLALEAGEQNPDYTATTTVTITDQALPDSSLGNTVWLDFTLTSAAMTGDHSQPTGLIVKLTRVAATSDLTGTEPIFGLGGCCVEYSLKV